jgi:hypothetical protein
VEKPVDGVEIDGRPNVRVLLRLSHDLPVNTFDNADGKEALKTLAATHGLAYDATSINAVFDLRQHSRRPLMCGAPVARRAAGGRS